MSATHRKIALMLASGEYLVPDPFDNLPEGIRWACDLALDPYCPERARDLLRMWVKDANHMLEPLRKP